MENKNGNEQLKIDKASIIRCAMELLQEKGIKKLSIWNVADRLNIKGASLYWHIKNKQELLELIADEVCKKGYLSKWSGFMGNANDRADESI